MRQALLFAHLAEIHHHEVFIAVRRCGDKDLLGERFACAIIELEPERPLAGDGLCGEVEDIAGGADVGRASGDRIQRDRVRAQSALNVHTQVRNRLVFEVENLAAHAQPATAIGIGDVRYAHRVSRLKCEWRERHRRCGRLQGRRAGRDDCLCRGYGDGRRRCPG